MAISGGNSFKTRDTLNVGAQAFDIHRLEHLEKQGIAKLATLPFSLRVLLENLLRFEDGRFVQMGSGRKRIFERIDDAQVAAWNRAILTPREPHDYRTRPDGTLASGQA